MAAQLPLGAQLSSRLEAIDTRLSDLAADVAVLKSGLSALAADVAELKSGQSALAADVSDLKVLVARNHAAVLQALANLTVVQVVDNAHAILSARAANAHDRDGVAYARVPSGTGAAVPLALVCFGTWPVVGVPGNVRWLVFRCTISPTTLILRSGRPIWIAED